MVQRKVPNKLGIQADHVRPEKRLGNLKPSSCHLQEGKNTGPDLKKKMKKSRSTKISDFGSMKPSPLRKTSLQPGKPPPLNAPNTATTPQKQILIKTTDGPPNYMKSTSSSEARKERSQVSSFVTRAGIESRNPHRRNSNESKHWSGSSNKPVKTLTRTCSLKLVRTLTKTPSFKPARATAKKCSRVALCEDIDIQRATCSSTMKDSKFPAYLTLNPGGTETEGTSVMKVCPYTYCSLNGHHHTPLPPLKCFLKARRRSFKTQKSMKLEVLSPRRAKTLGNGENDIGEGEVFFNDKAASGEADWGNSPTSPLIQERGFDYFIEIYAKRKEDDAEAIKGSIQGEDDGIVASKGKLEDHRAPPFASNDGEEECADDKQVIASLSDGSPHSDIDLEEYFEQHGKNVSSEMNLIDFFKKQKVEDADKDQLPSLAHEAALLISFYNGGAFEDELHGSIEADDTVSDASDMEWEDGQFSASDSDGKANYSGKTDDESDLNQNPDFHDESVISSDDILSTNTEEILADEEMKEVFEEESACFEETTMEEKGEEADIDLTGTVTPPLPTEEPIAETAATTEEIQENRVTGTENEIHKIEPQLGDAENDCTTGISAEALKDQREDQSLQHDDDDNDDATTQFQNQMFDCSQDFDQNNQVETIEDCNVVLKPESDQESIKVDDIQNPKITKFSNPNVIAEDIRSVQEIADESIATETQDDQSDSQFRSSSIKNHNFSEKDQNEANKIKSSSSINSEEQSDSRMQKISAESNMEEADKMEVEDSTMSNESEKFLMASDISAPELERTFFRRGTTANQQQLDNCNNRKWEIRRKRPIMDLEEPRNFNPREPNYLPVVPDPEAEKVDLRHQMMDDRKNAEEWMLDYALQQTVTKLAPARKKKVALLVEAFETVMPIPKYETQMRPSSAHNSAAFAHARPIQACS